MSLLTAIFFTIAIFAFAIGAPLFLLWLWGNAPR